MNTSSPDVAIKVYRSLAPMVFLNRGDIAGQLEFLEKIEKGIVQFVEDDLFIDEYYEIVEDTINISAMDTYLVEVEKNMEELTQEIKKFAI